MKLFDVYSFPAATTPELRLLSGEGLMLAIQTFSNTHIFFKCACLV
jgi:hypothetical protein